MAGETMVTIVGNLTGDPELRYTHKGLCVASFTIASTPRFFDQESREWRDGEALFLRCSAWGRLGEHIAMSLRKGMRVIARGQLQQRRYETEKGEKRSSFEMKVDELGPSLAFATAQVEKAERAPRRQSQSNEAWAAEVQRRADAPAAQGWQAADGGGFADEPPF